MTKSPLVVLTLVRLKVFFREPAAVFWTFGFPLILSVALGIAFRNKPPEPVAVGVEKTADAAETERVLAQLKGRADLKVALLEPGELRSALRTGKATLVVTPGKPRTYVYDEMRPESRLARALVDDTLQRADGRADPTPVADRKVQEPGSRYIDFLVPGLIGLTLMQSGMWGIGYLVVEYRTRKLLKRMVATPMRRSDFLLSFILMRLLFLLVELPVLVGFPWLVFGVGINGSIALFTAISFLGAFCFAGIGLLVGCRAENTQTVGGLMNLVMMPMFMCSGVFFSSANFPDVMQPFIRALPLTALNDALRAVMIEGAGLSAVAGRVALLAGMSAVSFALAVRFFRWT